jgi:sulfur-carrier protein adenylyltransferase/sulfurtransferase
MNSNRYNRQVILPEIGDAGQEKLSSARVLIVGAGGLGSPAALYLAAAGTGHIGIVDFDSVDITNLQRQILFNADQQGLSKALAAKKNLSALNPEISIQACHEELNAENALKLFSDYDIIIDGTDNFPAKFLINDAAVKRGKAVIYGSISGFEGQVSVFDATQGPCYRCLYAQPPSGHIPNCAEAGVIGALAGIIGSMQAMEAIKLIIAHNSFKPLIGKLWMIDSRTMETRLLDFPKKADCPTCSLPHAKIKLHYESPVCSTFIPEISVEKARKLDKAHFIDVRELNEWQEGHIEGAQHIPLSALLENQEIDLPAAQTYVLYCRSGKRSLQAAQIFMDQGIGNIKNLQGGYVAWSQATAA